MYSKKMHYDKYENVLLVVDYEKICRLCLHSTGVMSDIFENNSETCLKELILCATGLEVQQCDGLPTRICHKCLYIVELSCELRTMVARTHTLLTAAAASTQSETTARFKRNDATITQELRLVVEDEGEISLIEHQDDMHGGAKEKQNGGKTKSKATERTMKAAPKHLTCQICLSAFTTREQVREHAGTHYVDSNLTSYLELQRPYECETCRDGAISKKQLILHHRRHLEVNPFVCKQQGCGFVGKNQDSLRHHIIVHGARSQVCELCGAAYRRRWELRQHRARAHTAAPRECRACRPRRVFSNTVTYRAHLDTHRRPARHVCGWRGCPKTYHTPGALAAHRRSHAARRQHACPLCAAAAYTSRSLLNRHLRMHERARISKCDKCPATFEDYGAFYRHRVAAHGPWQPHRCAGCNQGYQLESKLAQHVRRCELAARMQAYAAGAPPPELSGAGAVRTPLVTAIQEVTEADVPLQFATEDLVTRLKGQALLVQPGNVDELREDSLVLPQNGLLYMEVEPDSDEGAAHLWQQV